MKEDNRLSKLRESMIRNSAITIVAYGDSWTYGSCADGWIEAGEAGNNAGLIHGSWAQQLQRSLQKRNPNVQFYNRGMGGWESTQGLERFDTIVSPLKPDYLILNFGINDWKNNGSLEDYKIAMETMIARSTDMGCQIVLWTAGPLSTSMGESYGWNEPMIDTHYTHLYDDYLEKLRQLATIHKLLLADAAYEAVELWKAGEDLSLWFGDAIHFKQSGHDLIFNCIQKELGLV
ncbi:SGNH/GDSL hydrolase family protein [Paenibacillus eucommiae]|uniref:Lysophospholipase L1-like esterase n=1 Tax=Paenibacillus eucommiae TaxID=1355755 RepID=A0ABS4IS63_9BACL|nr:SGNH/GDSL hydrolase family protein [Paenibacillus eucommiae]MBP1990408.1 lysophospholipase L1-like esterase [Paenibacillus eucommiae]